MKQELRTWDVEGFIQAGRLLWRDTGFWEREIWNRTEVFGDIGHVLSAYEGRVGTAESAPVTRGVNSFQFVRSEGRWWLVSTVWDIETPDNTVPSAQYGSG